MARKKGPVIGFQEEPEPEEAPPGEDPVETPSASFSSTSATSTCPHCNSACHGFSITDFRDHVASCTRPSTADDDGSSGSSLSTPPASPSQNVNSSVTDEVDDEAMDGEEKFPEVGDDAPDLEIGKDELTIDGQDKNDDSAEKDPRPYINSSLTFDHYDQSELQEGSDADQNPPEPTDKFPFPKVTDVDVFEAYLQDTEKMTYKELYRRTAIVSDNLVAYQAEWDRIDKEIFDHETYLKSEERRIDEEAKAAFEESRLIEDQHRDRVEIKFKDKLKLSGKKWQEFIADFDAMKPEGAVAIKYLTELRNPQLMAAARKKKRIMENKQKNLENAPWPEVKKTKEDLELERRRRGRYMDPVKFDDMKQADVYGFEYSAHIKHYGQQPMATVARQLHTTSNPTSNHFGDDLNDTNRTRTQRKQTRRVYEADASVTPEESDAEGKGLLPKRSRRPKIFIDGVETLERSRGQTRSTTPCVRTFASGKRVGRPPTKSKLQAVHTVQPIVPEITNGSEDPFSEIIDDGRDSRGLAASQEAQLHDAVESLVGHTINSAELPAPKPKHPGGRPRKIRPENLVSGAAAGMPIMKAPRSISRKKAARANKNVVDVDEQEFGVLKAKPKQRRRRVKKEPFHDEAEGYGVLQSTEQDDGSQYNSENITRPTTSDSNTSRSTFGSRRSERPATRDKTNAREARATNLHRRDSIQGVPVPGITSGRTKRKRTTADLAELLLAQPTFSPEPEPTVKKRRKLPKQEPDQVNEYPSDFSTNLPPVRNKRKRPDAASEINAVEEEGLPPLENLPTPKKRKRYTKKEKQADAQPLADPEEEILEAAIDESLMDPIAREALRKQRIKEEKSRKLSRNMKARWASGGMKDAQETRKTNNALKREWKKQALANEAEGLPPPPPPVLVGTVGTTPNAASGPKPAPKQLSNVYAVTEDEEEEDGEETPNPPVLTHAVKGIKKRGRPKTGEKSVNKAKRGVSNKRAKRPARLSAIPQAGDDGEDEDSEPQFTNEYDRYQALTSPGKPVMLGKRVRKSLVDLSQLMVESEEEEEEDEDVEEPEEEDDDDDDF